MREFDPTATENTSRRGSLIPESVSFPAPKSGKARTTKNSSRGRSTSVINVSTDQSAQPSSSTTVETHTASTIASQTTPEEQPDPTLTSSNSLAGQNTNLVPEHPVQSQPVQNPVLPQQQTEPTSARTMSELDSLTIDQGKLPQNYGRSCLKFEDDSVEELPAYLENVESIYKRCGGKTDADKKWIALHYCDARTKELWNSLPTRQPGHTWEEFIKEIKDNYPTLRALEKGSLSDLEKFVGRNAKRPFKLDDYSLLLPFNMDFRSRVLKLWPERITNREASKLYLKVCHRDLQTEIRAYLRAKPLEELRSIKDAKKVWESANPTKPFVIPEIDKDDRFAWMDMLDAAVEVCEEEEAYTFIDKAVDKKVAVLYNDRQTRDVRDDRDRSAPEIKELADKINKIEQGHVEREKAAAKKREEFQAEVSKQITGAFAVHMDKFTAKQHEELQQIRLAVEQRAEHSVPQQTQPNHSYQSHAPGFTRNRAPQNSAECFYCYGTGHFIAECHVQADDIKKGVIKMDGRVPRLYDGKNIPREPPNKSPHSKALEYFTNRHVATNYDALFDQFMVTDDRETYLESLQQPTEPSEVQQLMAAVKTLTQNFTTRAQVATAAAEGF